MSPPRLSLLAVPLLLVPLAPACDGDAGSDPPEAAGERGAVETIDPRLVLFDVQTTLESARVPEDRYPGVGDFTLSERWRPQREVLDAVFDEWSYASDGRTYRLSGIRQGRRYEIASPGP